MTQERQRPNHLILTQKELFELLSEEKGRDYIRRVLLPSLAFEGTIHAVHEEWKTRLQEGSGPVHEQAGGEEEAVGTDDGSPGTDEGRQGT